MMIDKIDLWETPSGLMVNTPVEYNIISNNVHRHTCICIMGSFKGKNFHKLAYSNFSRGKFS